MADVKRCDRCGRIYEKNKSFFAAGGIFFRGSDNSIAIIDSGGGRSMTYDLCNICMDDFKEKFMKGDSFIEVPQPESDD